ncbi:MAG: hypothetical protein JXQ26_08840 [Tissierellales bacterium]|nr:hypothetical protein [Tissierellales bacterium]
MNNKLFVTGLALGIENDACPCTNYNVDWRFNYPSTLLWAKKIIVTKSIWKTITSSNYEPEVDNKKEVAFSKALKIIFEILYAEGLIEVVDINGIISDEVSESIYQSIDKDIEVLSKRFPKTFKFEDDDNYFKIREETYCIPRLWTVYAGFILSRYFDANGLFSPYELNFYDYKYRIGSERVDELKGKYHAFQNVLELNLPNLEIGHMYLYDHQNQCLECKNEIRCKDSYLIDIEKNVKNVLQKRDYDEIQQIINLLNKISEKRDSNDFAINPIEFAQEFSTEKSKINRKVKSVFPKIKRWTNLTTFVSIPVALGGLVTGNPFLAISGGMITGVAKGSEELIKYFENKYNWINYLNR